MAMSTADTCELGQFGEFTNVLLVGNFGDGRITVFDAVSHKVQGQLTADCENPIAIDGLWGITFGADVETARDHGLYFAAGPEDEKHGVFGVIHAND